MHFRADAVEGQAGRAPRVDGLSRTSRARGAAVASSTRGFKMNPYNGRGHRERPVARLRGSSPEAPRSPNLSSRDGRAVGQAIRRSPTVQLGLLGHWGEWHTYPRAETSSRPPRCTQRNVVDGMHAAFPHKKLDGPHGDRSTSAISRGWVTTTIMIPEDTVGPEDWKFLSNLKAAGREREAWKVAPTGGEMYAWRGQAQYLGARTGNSRCGRVQGGLIWTWIGPY